MQPVSVIKFENVSKAFGATNAVDAMSFAARAGETIALLGPSGCGKTTTLRLIAGFEEPDSGLIEIAGESMQGKRPYERNVGLLVPALRAVSAYDRSRQHRLRPEAPSLAESAISPAASARCCAWSSSKASSIAIPGN